MGFYVLTSQRGLDHCYWNRRRGWVDDPGQASRFRTLSDYADAVRQSHMHE